jgi:hypothetical protein
MSEIDLLLDTRHVSPWAILATWLHLGAPNFLKKI